MPLSSRQRLTDKTRVVKGLRLFFRVRTLFLRRVLRVGFCAREMTAVFSDMCDL